MLWRARTGGTDNLGGFGVVTHRNITPGSSGSNFKAFHGSNPGFRPHPANQPKSVFRPKSSHQFISQLVTCKGVNANQVSDRLGLGRPFLSFFAPKQCRHSQNNETPMHTRQKAFGRHNHTGQQCQLAAKPPVALAPQDPAKAGLHELACQPQGPTNSHLFSLGNNHLEHRRNMCHKTVQRSWGTRREHKA